MTINKAESARDIDYIIPLIEKLYDGHAISKYISRAGYIAWIVTNLANPNVAIWYALEEGVVKGYCILERQLRLFEFNCHIHDVYMSWYDPKFSNEFMEKIESWARDNQCTTISTNTDRPDSMCKRYGFEQVSTLLIKAV